MGLLDSLLSPSTYGGQNGGLLDLLQNSLMQQSQYQPSAGFPQQQPGSGRSFDNSTFDPATYAPTQPANSIGVGGYQMPRIGNPDQFQPQQAMTPPNAQPTQGQGMPQGAQQAQQPQDPQQLPPALGGGSGGFGAGMRGFLNNAHTGPIGAILGGIGGAMGMQSPSQQNLNAQYQAVRQTLQSSGMSPQEAQSKAMLAVMNPEAGKTILNEALTNKADWGVVGEDPISGAKQYGWINKLDQTINGGKPNAGASNVASGQTYLNKGVSEYDPSLPGVEFLNQFAPDVQSAIMAYKRGDSMPTGNARKGWSENVKKWAQAYGDKVGEPVNDQTFFEKKKMKTDLGSSGNSTMGGILSNGESSFKHLAEYTNSAADQGNASHNYPLGGSIAHAQNYISNTLGGSDTQGKVKAINDNLGKYGAESTKFYAGTGGGVEERLNALKEMNATSTSGEEAASYAEKEKSLMLDRLNTKFQEIRNTLGEQEANREIAKHMPDIQKNIATIDANIAKLRGGQTSQTAPAANLPSGWSVQVR